MALSWDERGTLVPFSDTDELERLLDGVSGDVGDDRLPVIVTALDGDDPDAPALSIGCGGAVSVAVWRTPEATVSLLSHGDREDGAPGEFLFCGEPAKYPPSALISPESAREALRAFAASGTRPDGLQWQAP